jgi:hypothetical protein
VSQSLGQSSLGREAGSLDGTLTNEAVTAPVCRATRAEITLDRLLVKCRNLSTTSILARCYPSALRMSAVKREGGRTRV